MPVDFDRHESNALFDLHYGTDRDTGEPVLRKVSRGADTAQWLIHTEVAVGARLGEVPWPGGYPVSLCRLVDHGTQDGQPYVTTTYRGRPLTSWPAPLRRDSVLTVFADLLEAVQGLAKVGKAHGAITPGSVLWDGVHAQLVDLGEATGIGEPYQPTLVDPAWRPPGVAGGLLAGPAHDVYQVGLVIYCVVNRVAPADAATVRGVLAERAGTPLSALLAGMFADDPAHRPDPHDLQRRVDEARRSEAWQDDPTTFSLGRRAQPVPPAQPVPDPAATGTPRVGQVEPDSAATQPIRQPVAQPVVPAVGRVAPVPPPSATRLEYRRKTAAKREYRRREAQPALATWRYARELFEILWYWQPGLPKRAALCVVALLALPVVGVVMLVRYLGGDR